MTERRGAALERAGDRLAIGPSALRWTGDHLVISVNEVTAPLPSRIRGEIHVHPAALPRRTFELDGAGRHRWTPMAPVSRVEVRLDHPGLRWSGPGYLDSNEGDAALEEDFVEWDWCRAPTRAGAAILYNASRRAGGDRSLALLADRHGGIEAFEPPPRVTMPATRWRVPRRTRADAGTVLVIRSTLEDAPFYARSVIETRIGGEDVVAMHESLSLDRFRRPWVQAMLPFRMPRRF